MNKKVSLGVTVSLIAVACAITFVLTMTVSLNMYNSMVSGMQERETINAKIKEIDTFIRAESIYSIDETDLLGGIMDGYITGIEDKYAQYYTADEYYKLQQIKSGVIIGTGIVAQAKGDYLEITEVYEDSSAKVQELSKGDTITAIDKTSVLELGTDKALEMLDGEEGTKLTVTVMAADSSEREVTLIREKIELVSAKDALIDGYAYIRFTTFNDTTDEQFAQLIDKYESQSVLGYIFDVRDVSDGDVVPMAAILNRLVDKQVLANQIKADGSESVFIETDSSASIKKPMAVITNSSSSCLAELFAVSLRDYAGASVIGTKTAGKAEIQTVRSFKDGRAVSASTARIYPTKSPSFEKSGITPDYVVELNQQQAQVIQFADSEKDTQLHKALQIIATK